MSSISQSETICANCLISKIQSINFPAVIAQWLKVCDFPRVQFGSDTIPLGARNQELNIKESRHQTIVLQDQDVMELIPPPLLDRQQAQVHFKNCQSHPLTVTHRISRFLGFSAAPQFSFLLSTLHRASQSMLPLNSRRSNLSANIVCFSHNFSPRTRLLAPASVAITSLGDFVVHFTSSAQVGLGEDWRREGEVCWAFCAEAS